MIDLEMALRDFTRDHRFSGKGTLCVALVVTQNARKGLPLNPDRLLTDGGGQVLGLGRGAVQEILGRHGITRVLAAEGGRTSRGSIGNMRDYVAFLNSLGGQGAVDLDGVEAFWIARVHEFFAAKPFKLRLDSSRSLRTFVRDMIVQAEDRQRTMPGMQYAGAGSSIWSGPNWIVPWVPAASLITAFRHPTPSPAAAAISRLATWPSTLPRHRQRH